MSEVPIQLRPTGPSDLPDLAELWNDGRVMRFVGYPDGLSATPEHMAAWHARLRADPTRRHYVIHTDALGFCGEAYAHIDAAYDLAELDIKLRPAAQGRGIAQAALGRVIDEALRHVSRAYVEPSRANLAAMRLYRRLGFVERPRPPHLDPLPDGSAHLEVS